jgi:chorismate mutase
MPDPSQISKPAGPGEQQSGESRSETTVPELESLRAEIDRIDSALTQLVKERIKLIGQVAEIKERLALPTLDLEREKQVLAKVVTDAGDPDFLVLIEALYAKLFELSRQYQRAVRTRMKSIKPDSKPSLKPNR